MPDVAQSQTIMPETLDDFLLPALRDAHAMEVQALSLTRTVADRLEHYPDLQARFRQHAQETEGQQRRLDECLRALNASASTVKDVAMKVGANLQALMQAATTDEVVKTMLAGAAFERFEAACYRSLLAAAEAGGRAAIAEAARANLAEEEAMAAWVEAQVPVVTLRYIEKKAANAPAKR